MYSKRLPSLVLAALVIASSGCATQSPTNRRQAANVRTVAVTYAPVVTQTSTGSRVAGRVARHGAGFALGQLGFVGGIVGLAVDVVDISRPSREARISSTALQLLGQAGADPLALTAARTEKEIARRRLFVLANSNPDAVLDLELREVALKSADNRDLLCRATLGVTARLRSRSGSTLWKKESSATSGRVRLWRDYTEQPRLVRTDFDALAAAVSRQLLADFPMGEKVQQ
jgi:hypothetical protein